MDIPIFLITYNRLDVLKKSFEALKCIETPHQIVFCDNKSTYKPLIEWLKEKEREGYMVIWNNTSHLYNEITNAVNYWYKTNNSQYFMIMDPDVVLQCPPDVLEVLKHLLNTHKNKDRVGVVMRWDDLPSYYPLRDRVLKKQKRLYESKPKKTIKWKDKPLTFVNSDIDTTFTMFRKGFRNFKNVKNALVTLSPYHAKHLDWYINLKELTEEQKQYCLNNNKFAHWCGQHLKKFVKK